jgi:Tol biopolymer transport system component
MGLAAMLLVAIWLLTGCSTDSRNASRERTTTTQTTAAEARHSGNTSEQETTATETTMAGISDSCNISKEGATATERPVAEDARLIRLTHMGGAVEPVFSPDGKKIAFVNFTGGLKISHGQAISQGSPELYVMNSDGTNVICIAEVGAWGEPYVFSPAGSKIAYSVADSRGTYEIYVVDAAGLNPYRLTSKKSFSASSPAWSPDGTKIAFGATLAEGRIGNGEIGIMNSDGTNPINLTNTPPTAYEGNPSFSPNGEKIVFESRSINKDNIARIYVMNSDGTNRTLLPGTAYGQDPSFSPDGDHIAFYGVVEGLFGIGVMNSDGTDPIQIGTERDLSLGGAVFFPNGERIAIARNTKGGTDNIYAVNADGSNQSKLTNNDSANDSFPTFSPDGKKMAFVRRSYDDSGKFVSEIYLMNLD